MVLNTPDRPQVEKAEDLIRRYHLANTNLVELCRGLERLQHRGSVTLLRAILETNRDADVWAHACFALATILKSQANKTGDTETADESARMFEHVAADYGQVRDPAVAQLADQAKSELFELRRLAVGKTAPDIQGVDLAGKNETKRLSRQSGCPELLGDLVQRVHGNGA